MISIEAVVCDRRNNTISRVFKLEPDETRPECDMYCDVVAYALATQHPCCIRVTETDDAGGRHGTGYWGPQGLCEDPYWYHYPHVTVFQDAASPKDAIAYLCSQETVDAACTALRDAILSPDGIPKEDRFGVFLHALVAAGAESYTTDGAGRYPSADGEAPDIFWYAIRDPGREQCEDFARDNRRVDREESPL